MMRDELLKHLSALPADANIGVRIGDGHLDITDVAPWGDEGFVVLRCHAPDVRDVLMEWGLPDPVCEHLVAATDMKRGQA
jgi:hypothetical protein